VISSEKRTGLSKGKEGEETCVPQGEKKGGKKMTLVFSVYYSLEKEDPKDDRSSKKERGRRKNITLC